MAALEDLEMRNLDSILLNQDRDFNLSKAVEELSELATVLTQRLNSDESRISDQMIIDEIGDVQIRIDVLKLMFGVKQVEERICYKTKELIDKHG